MYRTCGLITPSLDEMVLRSREIKGKAYAVTTDESVVQLLQICIPAIRININMNKMVLTLTPGIHTGMRYTLMPW